MTRLKIGEAMPNDAKATPVAIEPEGDWYGLYKSGSRDDHLFTAASVQHPAKCSLALCNKILDTMQEWGWIETGSLVVDPFGGRGTTALCWLARNAANRALTVELEPHFVEMQNRNKEHAERRLHRELAWVILQGDSRRFSEYYAEGKAASVLSAPWEKTVATGDPNFLTPGEQGKRIPSKSNMASYADSAITSAPYAMNDGTRGRKKSSREWDIERGYGHMAEGSEFRGDADYGSSPGQIGDLADQPAASITSAPYSGDVKHDRTFAERDARADETKDLTNACGRGSFRGSPTYGDTPGQIGRLKDPPVACPCGGTGYLEWSEKEGNGIPCGCQHGAAARDREVNRTKNAPGPVPAACVTSAPYENSITDAKPGIDMSKSKRLASGRKDEGANSQVIIGGYQRDAAVLSAPYAAAENRRAAGKVQEGEVSDAITRAYDATNHGQTAGNIANLPDAALLSAPYATANTGGPILQQGGEVRREVYTDPAAAVTSAPFEDSLASDDPEKRGGLFRDPKRRNDPGLTATYGDAAAVTSQPFEAQPGGHNPRPSGALDQGVMDRHAASRIGKNAGYAGNEQGQIGVLQTSDARMLEILGARRPTKCQTATKISDAEIAAPSATVGDAKPAGGSIPTDSLEQPSTISASGMHNADDQDSISRGRVPLTGKAATGDGEGTDTSGSTTSLKSGTTTPAATAEQPGIQPESQSITSSLGKTAGRRPSKTSSPSVTPVTSTGTLPSPERISVSSADQSTCQREQSPDPAQNPVRHDSTPPNTVAGSQRSDQPEDYALACAKVYASLAKAGIRFVCSVTKDPVRKKRLRPLRLLTISLFEKAGYRLVAWRRAWLYHTQAELDAMAGQESLFGDEVEESKRLVGRLSFFRRLSLNRGGVASQWEDVLFFELDSAR